MSDFKKIKIISDGTVVGTKVVDETNIPLSDIKKLLGQLMLKIL